MRSAGRDARRGRTTSWRRIIVATFLWSHHMPRLRFIEETEAGPEERALIASAERTGAPDPRVVRIMTRSAAGKAWVKCWNSVLYEGLLPHKLKEMCRMRISVAHRCGYCSTVRSHLARAECRTAGALAEHPQLGRSLRAESGPQ